jgi:hypothetical protein
MGMADTLSSQDIVSLYKSHIPPEILENHEYKRMASALLQKRANIHPDLIYYTIEQYRIMYADSAKSSPQAILAFVHQKEIYYQKLKNDWLVGQKHKHDGIEPNSGFRSRADKVLRPLRVGPAENAKNMDTLIVPDSNRMHYYTLVYLARNPFLQYDASNDYLALCNDAQDSIFRRYEALYASLDNPLHKNNTKFIDNLVRQWYVFDRQEDNGSRGFLDAYQIINKILRNTYSLDRGSMISFGVGKNFTNSLKTFRYELPVSYAKLFSYSHQADGYPDPIIEIRPDVRQIVASLGCRIPINDYRGPFSFVNIYLTASTTTEGQAIIITDQIQIDHTEGVIDIKEITSSHEQISINSITMVTTKIGVPFVMINKQIDLECFFNAGLYKISSSCAYDYRMQRSERYLSSSPSWPGYYSHPIASAIGYGDVKLSETCFVCYPTLELVCNVIKPVQVRSVIGLRCLALQAECSF